MRLTLLQKDDCHLCDAALVVLAAAGLPDFDSAWIEDAPDLTARYGLRVPVLRCEDDGAELDWPFDPERVQAWLAERDGTRSG